VTTIMWFEAFARFCYFENYEAPTKCTGQKSLYVFFLNFFFW